MNSFAEIIEKHQDIDVAVKCRKCGAVPLLTGKQFSTTCPRCGNYIRLTPQFLAQLKLREYVSRYYQEHGEYPKPPKRKYTCHICQDTGLAVMEEQTDNMLQDYAFRCLCKAGQDRGTSAGRDGG